LILIVVVVVSVGTFAYFLSGLQTQSQNNQGKIQAVQNENLAIAYAQFYPIDWGAPNITSVYLTVQNLNTQSSGLIGVGVNGNETSLTNSSGGIEVNGNPYVSSLPVTVPSKGTVSVNISGYDIPRTSAIIINVYTSSYNTVSFSVGPPQASFIISETSVSNPNDLTLNASDSQPENSIQSYNWEISPTPGSFVAETGRTAQFSSNSRPAIVTLIVVNTYGLVSLETEAFSTTIPPVNTSNYSDPQFWTPYLSQLENIREVLMTPYGTGSYGYDSGINLTAGGNIEPSPAIGVTTGGYHNVAVAIDNNLEGSAALDFFNSASSPLAESSAIFPAFSTFNMRYYLTNPIYSTTNDSLSTTIYNTDRSFLNQTWYGVGSCTQFQTYYYHSGLGNSFGTAYDRREGEYGFAGPYGTTLAKSTSAFLGGIGSPACAGGGQSSDGGQTWYLPGYGGFNGGPSGNDCSMTQPTPCVVTVFPSGTPVGPNSDLEELSFLIDQDYMKCIAGSSCSAWQNDYRNAMTQFPFHAPRQALHFIQATRATQAWKLTNITYNGITPLQMVQITIQQVFTLTNQVGPMGVFGDIGPDGGLYQQWGGHGSSDTPEPNFQAMTAFDPNMPTWFTYACYQPPHSCGPTLV